MSLLTKCVLNFAGRVCICTLHYLQVSLLPESSCSCWSKVAYLKISVFCDKGYSIYISSRSASRLPNLHFCVFLFLAIFVCFALVLTCFTKIIWQVIASLAYLVYLTDGYQEFWLRHYWSFDNEISFYYICGKVSGIVWILAIRIALFC